MSKLLFLHSLLIILFVFFQLKFLHIALLKLTKYRDFNIHF